MKRPAIALLFFFAFALTSYCRAAQKEAVVIDVSGSMRTYGNWQNSARQAIDSVLSGQALPAGWTVTPSHADLHPFALDSEGRVTLLCFGSVRAAAKYPFFDKLQHSLALPDLDARFPITSDNYSESRTNKALAESVAYREVVDSSGTAQVLMLSDFYSDANLSDPQIAFIDETENSFAKYTLATVSWTQDPRVQIKLLRFVTVSAANATTPESDGLVLLPAQFDDRSRRVSFRWTYHGSARPLRYDVTVTPSPEGGRILFNKTNLAGEMVVYPNAAPGKIHWRVTAYLEGGALVEGRADYIVPGNNSSPIAVVVLVLALAAAAGTLIVFLKRHGVPDFLARLKRRPDNSV